MRSNEAAASAEPKPKPRSRRASGRASSATTARGVAEPTAAAAQPAAELSQNAASDPVLMKSGAFAADATAASPVPAIHVPSYPAQWTLTQRLEAEFVRASNIGARLAAAGQKIMAGLPPGAGPEETVLYMLQCQNTALEQSAAVLQVA